MAVKSHGKYNPALLRLELLSRGVKVDPEFSKQLGGSLKEPLWTRTGPTSTGIDLMLERGHYVSPAIEGERFPYHYKNSPFLLTLDEKKKPVIKKNSEQVGYDIEVYDPELYPKICPGKSEEVDRNVPHRHFNRMLSHAARKGGPNRTYSIIVTGLESCESTVAGVEHLCKMGVVPSRKSFRPSYPEDGDSNRAPLPPHTVQSGHGNRADPAQVAVNDLLEVRLPEPVRPSQPSQPS